MCAGGRPHCLSSGEEVAPAAMEAVANASPLVRAAFSVDEGRAGVLLGFS